ncbi:chorismate mutase [Pectinatus sottacetonis]|uniref:chorismate mutase n=1 Tax=Pectinatus sottacetonis TaxID=1002795 RepID=UPI0018C457A4|nr:chorismate mutase [Pectinatus sottacetonis]
MRGIRGAITVEVNESKAVCEAVQMLLKEMMSENYLSTGDIGAAIFSATSDITAAFPAAAARTLAGWDMVPLFDAQQMVVDNSIRKCIRVLLLVNSSKSQNEINHVYLRRAKKLRPDIIKKEKV